MAGDGPGPYSICVGVCGVGPAIIWLCVLLYALWSNHKVTGCNVSLWSWLGGCAVVFGIKVGGHLLKMVSDAPDFSASSLEVCLSCTIFCTGCFLLAWEIYGIFQYSYADGEICTLTTWTLVALIVNPIVGLMTIITMIVAQMALLPSALLNTVQDSGDDEEE
mmetsp:Transcript_40828/g.89303  ORF Transcript_40828/g.89303 Transcript_40828/m.89303 type:complete len:163 (+) Transcript_40828:73-561(+)|eukprot:CAMPEP_0170612978 /NCGR_PEP_ID=MMETSP0224-20130122/24022_1 /TAXON_ID=285029 /ORGANISM="Togula jolla, Strain CCCM 725" /LENGTH=162 /DNA_ID=CAMNT_0010938539 /DNA_START=69 /DNA_END=557 /DNA_ORIENTATION=-